jgi:hypothetical protein
VSAVCADPEFWYEVTVNVPAGTLVDTTKFPSVPPVVVRCKRMVLLAVMVAVTVTTPPTRVAEPIPGVMPDGPWGPGMLTGAG